jgi:DNA-binding transcriptional LysR family regulator
MTDYKCIVYRDSEGTPEVNWPVSDGSFVEVRPWLLTNSFRLMVQAVHAGLGIGLVPKEERRKNPELVELFPGEVQKSEPFSLIYVERELQLPHVRAFIERASSYWKQWIEQW